MIQIPVHQMILILLLCILCRASTAALRMAKPGCPTECGGLIIPYPFGIGPNETCYHNDWFQIDCNKSTEGKPVPVLRRTNLEVLNISTEEMGRYGNPWLQVNSPVTFFCKGNDSSQVVDLRRSPFVYSQSNNTFTAVSCNSLALLSSADFVVGGCRSLCDPNDHTYLFNCDIGINCCQTSIPPYLTVINATLYDEPTKNCDQSAFLVDKDWFKNITNSSFISTSDIKIMGKVPVTLEWSIINDTMSVEFFKEFIGDMWDQYGEEVYSGYNSSTDPSCYIYTYTMVNQSDIYCSCRKGYKGNPYLGKGYCEDIDECQESQKAKHKLCDHDRKCVNLNGSYRCHDNYRTEALHQENRNKAKLILAAGMSSSLGLLLLLTGGWFGYKLLKKRNEIKRKKMFFKRNGGLLLEQQLSSGEVDVEKIKLFKSEELEKSTDNFNVDRILGQGGQGTVYKGMSEDGRIIAVKKSKIVDESQLSGFINEVVVLSQINHRNVVKLLGCCLETEVPLLVYEYIPNGTLSKYITEQIEDFPFTWKMRLRIATEVAGALSHLHYTASLPIYHRDIKSTNILLDEKYRAKVADFGTSRSIAIDQTHLTTTLVHGTFGYLDPEYFQSSQFTEKSDVYSFGVVLVELLTGQRPISFLRSEDEGRSLATYFINSMYKDRLFEIVDAQVLKDGSKADIIAVANLARRCLNLNGRKRPTMREVTAELEGVQITETTSDGEQNYDEVEFVRTESLEPWDIASSSTGQVSSFHEIPLLSFNSR